MLLSVEIDLLNKIYEFMYHMHIEIQNAYIKQIINKWIKYDYART